MAEYIKDDGSYGADASLSGNYTTTSDVVTMTDGTGQGDTGITLSPTNPFILVETYDIDGVAGALSYHFWTTDVSDVAGYLAACQVKVEAEVTATNFTSYDMIATHFDGTGVSIHLGDEATSFPTTPDYTKDTWTPPTGSWKITDTLVAPGNLRRPVYVAVGANTPTYDPPTGVTINSFTNFSDTTTDNSLVDIDNVASDFTFRFVTTNWENGWEYNTGLGSDSFCLADMQLQYSIRGPYTNNETEIEIYLPAGTFEVTIGSRSSDEADNKTSYYTLDGVQKTLDAGASETYGPNCGTWTVTSTGANYILNIKTIPTGYYTYLDGFNIVEV